MITDTRAELETTSGYARVSVVMVDQATGLSPAQKGLCPMLVALLLAMALFGLVTAPLETMAVVGLVLCVALVTRSRRGDQKGHTS